MAITLEKRQANSRKDAASPSPGSWVAIRDATSESRAEPKDVIAIAADEPRVSEPSPGEPNHTAQVRLSLKQAGAGSINNVAFSITTPEGISCSQDHLQIPKLAGSTPVIVEMSFVAAEPLLPATMEVTATASYKSPTGFNN